MIAKLSMMKIKQIDAKYSVVVREEMIFWICDRYCCIVRFYYFFLLSHSTISFVPKQSGSASFEQSLHSTPILSANFVNVCPMHGISHYHSLTLTTNFHNKFCPAKWCEKIFKNYDLFTQTLCVWDVWRIVLHLLVYSVCMQSNFNVVHCI